MFGELEDSDIYVDNQNDSFEEQVELESTGDYEVETPKPQSVQNTDSKKVFVYILVLLAIFAFAAGFYFYKMKSDNNSGAVDNAEELVLNQPGEESAENASEQINTGQASEATAVIDVDLSVPAQQAAKPSQDKKEDLKKANSVNPADKKEPALTAAKEKSKLAVSNKPVVVSVSNGGRINPFMPYQANLANMPKFDIVAPPLDLPELDPLNDQLMATKISGIMYDSSRPSAIINIDGTDQLVHKGDRVKGYYILDITRDRVVIRYGSNIYRASVGQELDSSLQFNEVSNVSRQFGGAYSASKNLIEINANN